MKNAHEFPGLYDDLFDFPNAGYVMLDVENPLSETPEWLEQYEYVSPDPTKYWMKGLAKDWHVTVRGPLDPKVRVEHCETVLESMNFPEYLELGDIEVFPSPYPDEDYVCVVALVTDDALNTINQQLAILPGVQTYIPYKPHVTIGYFKSDVVADIESLINYMRFEVKTIGWNYGRMNP